MRIEGKGKSGETAPVVTARRRWRLLQRAGEKRRIRVERKGGGGGGGGKKHPAASEWHGKAKQSKAKQARLFWLRVSVYDCERFPSASRLKRDASVKPPKKKSIRYVCAYALLITKRQQRKGSYTNNHRADSSAQVAVAGGANSQPASGPVAQSLSAQPSREEQAQGNVCLSSVICIAACGCLLLLPQL